MSQKPCYWHITVYWPVWWPTLLSSHGYKQVQYWSFSVLPLTCICAAERWTCVRRSRTRWSWRSGGRGSLLSPAGSIITASLWQWGHWTRRSHRSLKSRGRHQKRKINSDAFGSLIQPTRGGKTCHVKSIRSSSTYRICLFQDFHDLQAAYNDFSLEEGSLKTHLKRNSIKGHLV